MKSFNTWFVLLFFCSYDKKNATVGFTLITFIKLVQESVLSSQNS